MSECGVASMTGLKTVLHGSCGNLVANTEAKVIDLTTGMSLPAGMFFKICYSSETFIFLIFLMFTFILIFFKYISTHTVPYDLSALKCQYLKCNYNQ